jgi:hypothetical protein
MKLTTEQLARMFAEEIQKLSEPEKAEVRERLSREFDVKNNPASRRENG